MEHRTDSAENGNSGAGLDALANTLNSAIRALQAAIGDDADLVRRLAGLQERLGGEQLQLSVLGQFKRGKSTFINALPGGGTAAARNHSADGDASVHHMGPYAKRVRVMPSVRVRFADGRSPEELCRKTRCAISYFASLPRRRIQKTGLE